MKKVMILGAGIYQVPLIKKAREMGLYTVVASIKGNYPGFKIADKVYYENTTDFEAILKIAKEEKIDGVIVSGTDVCVPTQGYVCDELNLCGPSLAAAKIAQDKALMKQAFVKHDVRTATVEYVDIENTNPVEVCEKIGYPVIFKSVDSSGSRGITRVNNADEIEYAYNQVKENTRSSRYIVEKFLVGEEFGAQAFVFNNKIKMFLPHGDYVFQGDTGVPVGHFAPYNMGQDIVEDAKVQLQNAINAMGVNNCAINADFILADGKVYVLEIGARAGATCLTEMTSIYFGYDYYEKIIQCALGEEPDFDLVLDAPQTNAEKLIISDKSGTITGIELPEVGGNIIDVSMDYEVGDSIHAFQKGPDRIGQVIVKEDSLEKAEALLEEVMSQIKITVE